MDGSKESNVDLLNKSILRIEEQVKRMSILLNRIEGDELPPPTPEGQQLASLVPSLKQLLLESPQKLNTFADELGAIKSKLEEDLL